MCLLCQWWLSLIKFWLTLQSRVLCWFGWKKQKSSLEEEEISIRKTPTCFKVTEETREKKFEHCFFKWIKFKWIMAAGDADEVNRNEEKKKKKRLSIDDHDEEEENWAVMKSGEKDCRFFYVARDVSGVKAGNKSWLSVQTGQTNKKSLTIMCLTLISQSDSFCPIHKV